MKCKCTIVGFTAFKLVFVGKTYQVSHVLHHRPLQRNYVRTHSFVHFPFVTKSNGIFIMAFNVSTINVSNASKPEEQKKQNETEATAAIRRQQQHVDDDDEEEKKRKINK